MHKLHLQSANAQGLHGFAAAGTPKLITHKPTLTVLRKFFHYYVARDTVCLDILTNLVSSLDPTLLKKLHQNFGVTKVATEVTLNPRVFRLVQHYHLLR